MAMRLITLAALTVLLGLALSGCGGDDGDESASNKEVSQSAQDAGEGTAATSASSPATSGGSGGRVVEVLNRDLGGSGTYEFDPSDLTFRVGETVTLSIAAESEFHTFTVDGLGIDVSVDGGEIEEITYTFDRAGTFQLICIPHESLGMVGTITVE